MYGQNVPASRAEPAIRQIPIVMSSAVVRFHVFFLLHVDDDDVLRWVKNGWIGAKEKCAIKKVVKLADQLQKFIPSKEVIDLICGKVESGLHLCINYCDGVSGHHSSIFLQCRVPDVSF